MKINKFEKYFKKYSYDVNKVVGFNPFDFNDMYVLENGVLSEGIPKNIKQEHLFSTYIPNKNLITYEFKLQKNLLDKIELDDYIETKCYEDVGLDEAEEYIFKHKLIYSKADEKNVIVEVAIISKKEITNFYQPLIKERRFLDYIAYPGFVFDVLYKDEILEPQADLYVLFTKDDIIITLYNEGNFLQTSLIPEGLEIIYSELMESIKIKDFNFDMFSKLITKKGLEVNNYSEKELVLFNELSELFSNKFLIISNQLHLLLRKFSLTTIDRIFMGTPKGVIPGISEFANMYLGVEANDLKFDTDFNPNNIEIDQVLFLSMLSASYSYRKHQQVDNFSIFNRPPTFFYRQSGQFISITVASIILSLVYPVYQSVDSYFISLENTAKQAELNILNAKNRTLNTKYKKLYDTLKAKKKQKEDLITYIKDRETIINSIYLDKKGYVPKSSIITIITKYLYDNKVYLKDITYGDIKLVSKDKKKKTSSVSSGSIMLNVYSRTSKNITNFINDMVKQEHLIVTTPGYQKINDFYNAKIIIKVEE